MTAHPITYIHHFRLTSVHYADETNISIKYFESVLLKQRIAKSKDDTLIFCARMKVSLSYKRAVTIHCLFYKQLTVLEGSSDNAMNTLWE